MSDRSILISGASIAGPALASWLGAAGWDVTVVERFGQLREEGHNIDVRGVGRQVLRRMGLDHAAKAAHTGERGMEFVDEHGKPLAVFPGGPNESGGATAELEILHGQLGGLLYEQSANHARYRFGDQISTMRDDGAEVDVWFQSGARQRFDAMVLAEGLRSRTRALIMPEAKVHELGVYTAHLSIPRIDSDNDRWSMLVGERGRHVYLRPDNVGTTRAALQFLSDVRGLERLDRADQISLLRETFADLAWQTPRILEALDNGSMYFDGLGQMRLDEWSRGRVTLLGDAAYCASPFSGMGTTLALTGAYILAGELTRHADPRAAFTSYERKLRPLVQRAQQLPFGLPRSTAPRGRIEHKLFHALARAASTPLYRGIAGVLGRFNRPRREVIRLPDYPIPSPAATKPA